MARNLFLFSALTGLLGCGLFGPEEPRLDTRTDRPEYVRDPATRLTAIQLTVTNRSHHPTYLTGCPGVPSFAADREDGGAWREFGQVNVVCQAIYSPTYLTLLPGESHTSSFTWNAPGTFRLRVPYGAARDNTWDRSSTSPSFVVR